MEQITEQNYTQRFVFTKKTRAEKTMSNRTSNRIFWIRRSSAWSPKQETEKERIYTIHFNVHNIIYIFSSILFQYSLLIDSFSSIFYSVAPLCRPGQVHIYNVARQETAKVICELESNPNDLNFTWKFNNTIAESLDLPASLIAVDRAKSIAHYTPMVEQVRFFFFTQCKLVYMN